MGGRLPESLSGPVSAPVAARLGRFCWAFRPECIAAGVGSDEVLEWIFKVFCQPGVDSVVTAEPTYGMYQVTAGVFGVDWRCFPLDSDFQF